MTNRIQDGPVDLNWWVYYACECWAVGQVGDFWDAIERAFAELQKSSSRQVNE